MQSIFDNALPFFALIFCGYGAGRLGLLDETAAAGVNTFVFYFALPAFLFGLMSSSPLGEVVNGPFIGAYVTAWPSSRWPPSPGAGCSTSDAPRQRSTGLAAVLANTGYMGIPLVSAVFGSDAAVPIVVGLTLDGILIIPLGIIIIESSKGGAESLPATALATFSALARNPLILAILAGLAASAGASSPHPGELPGLARRHGRPPAPFRPRRHARQP